MVTKGVAKLIYIAKGKRENGSPVELETFRNVRVDITKTFSSRYYFERGRDMRDAMNIRIPKYLVDDIHIDCNVYRLMYAEVYGVRFMVAEVLNDWTNFKDNHNFKVLDLKKVI